MSLLLTWTLAWPAVLASLIVAVACALLGPIRRLLIGSAVGAAGFGLWLLWLIPGAPGAELAGVTLALGAFATASYTVAVAGALSHDIPAH